MFDQYNRDITYLRVSVTDRCNLRCSYCMPPEGVKLKKNREILSYEEIVKIVQEAAKLRISKIRLTGGEPLIRKNICYLIRSIKFINGIQEITLTTNGILLAQMAQELREAGLDRINISMDTLSPKKYREITRGGDIKKVFEGIDAVIEAGFDKTKLNMVIIPGFNKRCVEKMVAFCREKRLVLQRINHYSLCSQRTNNQEYKAERPLPCSECNRIRLTSDGKLKPCLFSNKEYPVNLEDIASSIKNAIINKPKCGKYCSVRGIWEIGG